MVRHLLARSLAVLACLEIACAPPSCNAAELVIKAHPAGSLSVAFSPDGSQIATGGCHGRVRVFGVEGFGMIGEVKIWDAATGQRISELPGLKAAVECVAYSPDGKFLAAGCGGNDEDGKDYTIYLWETDGFKLRHKIPLPGPSTAIAFSPDSKSLAAGVGEGRNGELAFIWDIESGQESQSFRTAGMRGYRGVDVAFSPDGQFLATGRSSGMLANSAQIWNIADGQVEKTIAEPRYAHCIVYSPDGKLLAISAPEAEIRLYASADGTLLRTLYGHKARDGSGARALAFSPNSQVLASGGDDRDIRLWNTASVKAGDKTDLARGVLTGHNARVTGIAFAPDGKRLASASDDLTVRVWDINTGDADK